MKSILISIKPEWVALILNGNKTIEIRKTIPKCELPIKCYIYCTKSGTPIHPDINGRVVGEFTLDKIDNFQILPDGYCYTDMEICQKSCMIYGQIERYVGKNKIGYAWYIDNLKIYDKPKELSEFGVKRAFQSWGYINGKNNY